MRNKTPFISRSGQRAPYLGGFDWSCHWSPWASPASESHLEHKLPWGRGRRCQHPAGKIVSPSELLRSMDSCEGRTKPGQILDSERWRYLLPGKDFCLQIVIYNPGGRQGEQERNVCLCLEESWVSSWAWGFQSQPPGLLGNIHCPGAHSSGPPLLLIMRLKIPTPFIHYNLPRMAHKSVQGVVDQLTSDYIL